MLDQPAPCFRIAKIKQLLLTVRSQQPFGMMRIEPRAGGYPLRLKPDDRLKSLCMGVVRDGPQAPWKPAGMGIPNMLKITSISEWQM